MTPAEMRAKADQCQTEAQTRRDPGAAKMYAELARQWRELADHLEKVRK
jgi:hypothetical protein